MKYSAKELGFPVRYDRDLEEFPTSFGAFLGANVGEAIAMDFPTNLLVKNLQLRQANEDAPRLSPDQIKARTKLAGVEVDVPSGGLSEDALNILIKRRREELVRADTINRFNPGLFSSGLGFVTQLGTSLFDPINVASAFIPIVGQARYASMLSRATIKAGRAAKAAGLTKNQAARLAARNKLAVRAKVGAVEGAAGTAILEPGVYALHQGLQDDYDFNDSLLNVAFGSVLGGGLHVVGGAGLDAFRARRTRLRKEALGVVQESRAFGNRPRPVDDGTPATTRVAETVDRAETPSPDGATLRSAPEVPRVEDVDRRATDLIDRAVAAEAVDPIARTADHLLDIKAANTPELRRAVEITRKPGFQRNAEEKFFIEAIRKGAEPEFVNARLARALKAAETIDRELARPDLIPEQAQQLNRDRSAAIREADNAARRLVELGENPLAAANTVARVSHQTRVAALRAAIAQAFSGRQVDIEAVIKADPKSNQSIDPAAVKASLERQADTSRSSISAEPEASRQADDVLRRVAESGDRDTILQSAEQALEETMAELEVIENASRNADVLDEVRVRRFREQARKAGNNIQQRLLAAGENPEVAEALGRLYEARYRVRADRLGISPEELAAREPIEIVNRTGVEDPVAFAYAQGPADDIRWYYSSLINSLERVTQGKATADEWKKLIEKQALAGVKQEEVDWVDVNGWLDQQTGKIRKEDLLTYLRENQVVVTEIIKGAALGTKGFRVVVGGEFIGNFLTMQEAKAAVIDKISLRIEERVNKLGNVVFELFAGDMKISTRKTRAAAERDFNRQVDAEILETNLAESGGETAAFIAYQLPGGERYREFLLTLPEKRGGDGSNLVIRQVDNGQFIIVDTNQNAEIARLVTREAAEFERQRMIDNPENEPPSSYHGAMSGAGNFMSAHWDEPNVIVHTRTNERVDVDGKKVLFIEEIQSDWHQRGREQGYKGRITELPDGWVVKKTSNGWGVIDITNDQRGRRTIMVTDSHPTESAAKIAALEHLNSQAVPDAPFKKTYPLLAMKRMIRHAVENDLDRVAWTTGAQQEARWPGSKHQWFYDRDLVNDVNKYIKKWGAKVELKQLAESEERGYDVNRIPVGDLRKTLKRDDLSKLEREVLQHALDHSDDRLMGQTGSIGKSLDDSLKKLGILNKFFPDKIRPRAVTAEFATQHVFDITPEMRAAVKQGQPLFQQANPNSERRVTIPGNDEVVASAMLITGTDNAFQLPVSKSADLLEILQEVTGNRHVQVREITPDRTDVNRRWSITQKIKAADDKGEFEVENTSFINELDRGMIYLDISDNLPGAGGFKIYSAIANWAHNTGRVFIEDPAGLSRASIFRRTEAMLNSALKFGTTRHIAPGRDQMTPSRKRHGNVEPLAWKDDDAKNIRELMRVTNLNVTRNVPEVRDMVYNLTLGRFERLDGTEVTNEQFNTIAQGPNARSAQAGTTTLKRAILAGTLDQASRGEGRGKLLGIVSRIPGLSEGNAPGGLVRAFYQEGDGTQRGSIQFQYRSGRLDGATITRLQNADASTFLHETGHLWLEELIDDASVASPSQAQLRRDLNTVLDYLGVQARAEDGPQVIRDRLAIEHHETFARSVEAYVREGNAPSTGLTALFRKFANWLLDLYRNLQGLNVGLTDDVRVVLDRLLATDAEIASRRVQDIDAGDLADGFDPGELDPIVSRYDDYHRALRVAAVCGLG